MPRTFDDEINLDVRNSMPDGDAFLDPGEGRPDRLRHCRALLVIQGTGATASGRASMESAR